MNDRKCSLQGQQPNHPQIPKPPFPYDSEEVKFNNDVAGITLAGMLTLPATPGQHSAVILIAGMGPADRDGTFNDHKPLWGIADHFSRHGIAVLRFDKWGVGQSTGKLDLNVTSKCLAGEAGINFIGRASLIFD